MNKKIIVTALVGMLLLTSCSISIDIDADRKSGDNTDIISNHELTMKELEDILNGTEKKDNEIKFIDGIYGVYGEDDGAMYQDTIEVFKGKDENHIDISAYFYRRASFYMKDMEIIRNKNGEVIATKFVGPEESVWDYFVKDQYLGDATLDVIIKDNTVKLRFNKDLNMIDKETEKEKINLKDIAFKNPFKCHT